MPKHPTSLKAGDIICNEIQNCGIDSPIVSTAAGMFIAAGVTIQTAEALSELIFAVYYATKAKYGLTLDCTVTDTASPQAGAKEASK